MSAIGWLFILLGPATVALGVPIAKSLSSPTAFVIAVVIAVLLMMYGILILAIVGPGRGCAQCMHSARRRDDDDEPMRGELSTWDRY
jgi:putative effector of murein hydrolase